MKIPPLTFMLFLILLPIQNNSFYLTTDSLFVTIKRCLGSFESPSILANLTCTQDPLSKSVLLKNQEFLVMVIFLKEPSMDITFTTKLNNQLSHHVFYANFRSNSEIKTDPQLDALITDKLNAFSEHYSYVLSYLKSYGDTRALTEKIQDLLAQNSKNAINKVDFKNIFDEPIDKINSSGLKYKLDESKAMILGNDHFLRLSVQNFQVNALVQIDLPNYQIKAFINPQLTYPLGDLEKSVQNLFVTLPLDNYIKIEKVKDIINKSIGNCEKFAITSNPPEIDVSLVRLEYVKVIIESTDNEGFRRTERKLGDDDCNIHKGEFGYLPLVMNNFAYIQIVYIIGEEYINESLFQIGATDVFENKIVEFVKEIVSGLDLIYGNIRVKKEVIIKTYLYSDILSLVIDNAAPAKCGFEVEKELEKEKSYYCKMNVNKKEVNLVEVITRHAEKSPIVYEINLLSPANSEGPTVPFQSYSIGLMLGGESLKMIGSGIKEFVNKVNK